MQLNIKSEDARALAVALARETGESITAAVTRAIRERLEKVRGGATSAEDLLAIGRDCAAHLKEPWHRRPCRSAL
jgi:antitoxin VapB